MKPTLREAAEEVLRLHNASTDAKPEAWVQWAKDWLAAIEALQSAVDADWAYEEECALKEAGIR